MLWCGNSPDCNCFELCWIYIKRETTKKGAPTLMFIVLRFVGSCMRWLAERHCALCYSTMDFFQYKPHDPNGNHTRLLCFLG
ncbi:hypothetical protein DE146DRAFT_276046 [Phaeosphaeria sp. MPI-PUGE-AT-0046c]|nr:hypothetical protein DE146DRAFT_276046 [Phaeosphaeria sp. MPI-PUGE-AT-0046c]